MLSNTVSHFSGFFLNMSVRNGEYELSAKANELMIQTIHVLQ
jgi:hypothetical protein